MSPREPCHRKSVWITMGLRIWSFFKGDLIVSTSVMQVVELQPYAYQEDVNGFRKMVPCRYKVNRHLRQGGQPLFGGNVFNVGYPVPTDSFQTDFAGGSTDIAIFTIVVFLSKNCNQRKHFSSGVPDKFNCQMVATSK